jgi:protein TonB
MTKVETEDSEALIAREEERLLAPETRARFWSRSRFVAILAAVLLAHAALLLYLLYRDRKATMETAQLDETPIEVVVQPPPPEPPKPPPPPPPAQ